VSTALFKQRVEWADASTASRAVQVASIASLPASNKKSAPPLLRALPDDIIGIMQSRDAEAEMKAARRSKT